MGKEGEMSFKGTQWNHEEGDFETEYFRPSWHREGVSSQSVAIAPAEDRMTSMVFLTFDGEYQTIHFWFTEEETDAIIAALQENKRRWDADKKTQ